LIGYVAFVSTPENSLLIMIRTTVICAVWHMDENREHLLREHVENIAKQTLRVNSTYVFDNGDSPPKWLQANKIVSSTPLTIYEAWNLALATTVTPLVMNLNLDDRLCFDAIELLEGTVERENAFFVGGDWKICYSQEETNRVAGSYSAFDVPFVEQWPPVRGTNTRLGSGTSNRGTFGPATMWSMNCHLRIPRYPYRTTDGSKIFAVADTLWWTLLIKNLGVKSVRIPKIIGNYFSHPNSQLEFRHANELQSVRSKSISLI
jgi:hypothetical protein